MRLRYGSSFWLRRSASAKRPRHPPLQREVNVDVAIVGGGFTGCAVALIFAQAGVRVAVLEEAQLGHGSAAASTALLMQEPDRYFTELVRRHGRSTAETIWRLSRRGVEDLTSTLERLKCGLRPTPSLHLALDRDRARDLRRDIAARRRAGLGGRLLEPSGLRRRTGIEGAAAILSSGNAVVDPYRATLALAREAARAGAL
ncbi:MAG: FAD-binding oxidoreductase, partial [Acidobacteria bacterium]|nr:FAD-binding oxidoreductase [Acidobacteriota bacterium]